MNKNSNSVKEPFSRIERACAEYRRTVTKTLEKYRTVDAATKKAASAYKDEEKFYNERMNKEKADARIAIQMAENALTGNVSAEIPTLRESLRGRLIGNPRREFVDALQLVRSGNLQLTKCEIEALADLAAGSPLSLRALNGVLEGAKSLYRVRVPDAAQFERDLNEMENLARGNIRWAPHELCTEYCAIYKGTPRAQRRRDGSSYQSGTWDARSLIIAAEIFQTKIDAIAEMSERWSMDGLTNPVERIEDAAGTEAEGKGTPEVIEDQPASAERLAADLGRQRAAGDQAAKAAIAQYL